MVKGTPSRGWECSACGLVNRGDIEICEVCEEPRPRGEEFGTPRSDGGRSGNGEEFGTPRSDNGHPSNEFATPRNELVSRGRDGENTARSLYFTDSSAGEQSDGGQSDSDHSSIGDPDTARSFASAKGDLSKGMANLDIDAGKRSSRQGTARSGGEASARSQGGGDFSTPREFGEGEVREAFNAFDSDGDGFLTVADVKLFFEALGEAVSEAEVRTLMQQVDVSQRGRVSFDEFFEMANACQFIRG